MNPEILNQLQDFRQRILQADKLRRQGAVDEGNALMPSREELIQAVKAYRQSIGQRSGARATSAKAKTSAAAVASMAPENLLD